MSLRDAQRGLGALLELDIQIDRRKQQIAALDPGTKLAASYKVSKPKADSLRAEANRLAAIQKDAELTLAGIETKIKTANEWTKMASDKPVTVRKGRVKAVLPKD